MPDNKSAVRLLLPVRDVILPPRTLDQLLPAGHNARLVWHFVQGLDISALLARYRCLAHAPGRTAIDPRVLVALWLQATIDGIDSARELARRAREHLPYQWLVGSVPVAYRTLSDFRIDHRDWLDAAMRDSIRTLMGDGLLTARTVAHDGMRVRASAGADTLRGEKTLTGLQKQARDHLEEFGRQADATTAAVSPRSRAAALRHAKDRLGRIEAALAEIPALAASREAYKKGTAHKARASTTDPRVRNTKMPDGGYRPAYNAQVSVDVDSGIILAIAATTQATDNGLLGAALDRVTQNCGSVPARMLADSGFVSLADVEAIEGAGCEVVMPPKNEQKDLDDGKDPYAPKPGDGAGAGAWRKRMGTREAKTSYRRRGQSVELANAWLRRRGLYRVTVRGERKVGTVLVWHALAHNLVRAASLRSLRAGEADKKSPAI